MQGVFRTLGRLQAVELQHCLHPVLLEYHDPYQLSKGGRDRVKDVTGYWIGGVEDREEEDMVGLLSLVCPLVQLDVDQLRREEDGMGPGGLLVVGVVVDPRPLCDGGDQAVGVIHVQGHLSACLDMCCGGDMCWLAACSVVSCGSVPVTAQLRLDCVFTTPLLILSINT